MARLKLTAALYLPYIMYAASTVYDRVLSVYNNYLQHEIFYCTIIIRGQINIKQPEILETPVKLEHIHS